MSRLAFVLALCLLGFNSYSQQKTETAIFAGGCFWCEEEVFEKVPGVISVTSGYTDGRTKSPTYDQVSSGDPMRHPQKRFCRTGDGSRMSGRTGLRARLRSLVSCQERT